MLTFEVYSNNRPAKSLSLQGAYLVGSDGVPLRADIEFKDGKISCTKRTAGPASLALLRPVDGVGTVMQESVRIQERSKPYNLHVELARGRLMRIAQKREDWGLYDYEGSEDIIERIESAQKLLVQALQASNGSQSAHLADKSLREAVIAGEELSQFHAEIFLRRRVQSGSMGNATIGCVFDLEKPADDYLQHLIEAFDFVTIPVRWRNVEPKEQEHSWQRVDTWMDFFSKRKIPIKAGPLVSFDELSLPDWLYIWEHDYETARDMTCDHVRRVVKRYGNVVQQWHIISGLHAVNAFNFNFEQIMEMTRITASLVKQLAPRAQTVIDLVLPWGEYYARNQRTIPPLLYADMVVQGGINFDAFGLHFTFGRSAEGMYVRDMFQISSMLDRFSNLGKPLHVSTAQVPSTVLPAEPEGDDPLAEPIVHGGGYWHGEWSEKTQAEWLKHFCLIALSKPFVESFSWRALRDVEMTSAAVGAPLLSGGLLRANGEPKPGYRTLLRIREELRRREAPEAGEQAEAVAAEED